LIKQKNKDLKLKLDTYSKNNIMKKLTELDLQNALDECEEKRFRTHGDWLTGMVRRLNAALDESNDFLSHIGNSLQRKKKVILPPIKTIIQTGNNTEPEVPCIS